MKNRFLRPTEKFKIRALTLALICLNSVLFAQTPETWRVLIEPKFMRPEVSFPIAGAQRTVLVPAYLNKEGDPHYFSRREFEALKVDWAAFMARARENATDRKLKAEFVRDRNEVVSYGAIRSDSPLTATAVLSPEFAKSFAEIFGPEMLVVVPNRFTIFLFPKLASRYTDYAPMVLEAYKATPYPVSIEVFELGAQGLKAIGIYEEP